MGLWIVSGTHRIKGLVDLFNPAPFAVLTAALVAAALVLRRGRAGATAFVAMLGANVTTQALKPLLAVQRDTPLLHHLSAESWPSGHATATMSFALALALVSPPRLRPLAVAAGALITVVTVYAVLIYGSHYPSDIVGGFLVATAWACVAAAILEPEAGPSPPIGPALATAALVTVTALAVAARPTWAFNYAVDHTTFVFGALAIAGGAVALSGSVPVPTAARRRPLPRSRRATG